MSQIRTDTYHLKPGSSKVTSALVRAPTVKEVQQIALAGKTMPEKSTYFFPKLASGLLFSPFDE